MLPGKPVAEPAGFANRMIAGSATTTSNALTKAPATLAPGAAASSKLAGGAAAAGFATRHLTPGPQPGIVYDAMEGRYVNSSSLASAVNGTNGLSSGSQVTTLGTTHEVRSETQVPGGLNHEVLALPSPGSAKATRQPAELPIRPLAPASSGGKNSVFRAVPVPSETPQRSARHGCSARPFRGCVSHFHLSF